MRKGFVFWESLIPMQVSILFMSMFALLGDIDGSAPAALTSIQDVATEVAEVQEEASATIEPSADPAANASQDGVMLDGNQGVPSEGVIMDGGMVQGGMVQGGIVQDGMMMGGMGSSDCGCGSSNYGGTPVYGGESFGGNVYGGAPMMDQGFAAPQSFDQGFIAPPAMGPSLSLDQGIAMDSVVYGASPAVITSAPSYSSAPTYSAPAPRRRLLGGGCFSGLRGQRGCNTGCNTGCRPRLFGR